ncbi:uncharacterized protein LOC143261870 [Megalopta genalis]|uniref:uncharacterized protein LOC143261870 n=1 Tax=Megalopta genalis TaxID=115081 RepID=UPI003FD2928D
MWEEDNEEMNETDLKEYLFEFIPAENEAAGCDGIYNFFIKKCEALHPFLYDIMKEMCIEGRIREPWLYNGITYLIPKGTLTKGGDFRPITYDLKLICEKEETLLVLNEETKKFFKTIGLVPTCKETLYLPRTKMGRGLINVEHRSEYMLFNINQNFNETRNNNLRCSAILKVEEENETHLAAVDKYLNIKYDKQMLSVRDILEVQKETLYNKIKNKNNHKKLYNVRDNELVSIKGSPTWLAKGNNQARSVRQHTALFKTEISFAVRRLYVPTAKKQRKTVDRLATKYKCMLGFDSTRRHNEVVRCIHLLLCKKYGFKKSNKIRSHSVQEILKNENAEIRADTRISTDIKVTHNKPDILSRTKIVPYVMTWDGVITKFHKKYLHELGIQDSIEAYIQSVVLKKTLESISIERRRGLYQDSFGEEEIERAVEGLVQAPGGKELKHNDQHVI